MAKEAIYLDPNSPHDHFHGHKYIENLSATHCLDCWTIFKIRQRREVYSIPGDSSLGPH